MEYMVSDERLAVLNADDDVRARVAECVDEYAERGFWRSCSGCHELSDGAPTGKYSKAFNCHLGSGCGECGGIGAVWDMSDYFDMADTMLRGDTDNHGELPEDVRDTAYDEADAFSDWYGCDSDKRKRLTEAFGRVILVERLRNKADGGLVPTLWICFAANGNIRAWAADRNRAELFRLGGLEMVPFAGPVPDRIDGAGQRYDTPSPEAALAEEILAELVRARTKFPGMTLRDWFAGQAFDRAIDQTRWPSGYGGLVGSPNHERGLQIFSDGVAKLAYRFADAMLAARTKEQRP